MSYKVIELEQGSSEWLEYRRNKITATDTAVIMGLNPWKTPLSLWEEKLGLKSSVFENDKMVEGRLLEEEARNFLNSISETQEEHFLPKVLTSIKYPFMMVSLDAINDLKEIVEIKCGKGSHDLAKQGIIPNYYVSQCQKQMFVSGCDKMEYFSFRGINDNVSIVVKRDDAFIEKMIAAETEFYRRMIEFDPPEPTDRDYEIIDSKEWRINVAVLREARQEIKKYKEREEAAKLALIELSSGRSCKGHGVRVRKSVRKGAVDYSRIKILETVSLDDYRKKPIEYYSITEGD